METDIKIRLYCDSVCAMVRWKPARPAITEELAGHLEDHAQALVEAGMDYPSACARAVAAMGSPYELGKALDVLHSPFWHRVAAAIVCLSLVLFLVLFFLMGDHGYDSPAVTRYRDLFYAEDATLETFSYGDEITAVAARGRAAGGGRLGDYWLVPGRAVVLALTPRAESGKQSYTELRVTVTDLHWQLWLESMSYSGSLGAYDSTGARYPASEHLVSYEFLSYTPLTGRSCLTLENPNPEAEWYVFELTAVNGDPVSFRVTLDWGESDE